MTSRPYTSLDYAPERAVQLATQGAYGAFRERVRLPSAPRAAPARVLVKRNQRLGYPAPDDDDHERRMLHRLQRCGSAVPQVVDYAATDPASASPQPGLLMEAIEGVNLYELCTRPEHAHRRSWDVLAEVILQAMAALDCLHASGVVHHDIKPENIMVSFVAGLPWVRRVAFVDLGAACTVDGEGVCESVEAYLRGSPLFMHPKYAIAVRYQIPLTFTNYMFFDKYALTLALCEAVEMIGLGLPETQTVTNAIAKVWNPSTVTKASFKRACDARDDAVIRVHGELNQVAYNVRRGRWATVRNLALGTTRRLDRALSALRAAVNQYVSATAAYAPAA